MSFDRHEGDTSAFARLPFTLLADSCRVDFMHLLYLDKPCIRTYLDSPEALSLLKSWCLTSGLSLCHDDEYACIAWDHEYAHHVLQVDQSCVKHEYELGLLLGYPTCCAEHAGVVGEQHLDDYAACAASWPYPAPFALINPTGYSKGASLVCHIPCSPTCARSLDIARAALSVIQRHAELTAFGSWQTWFRKDS